MARATSVPYPIVAEPRSNNRYSVHPVYRAAKIKLDKAFDRYKADKRALYGAAKKVNRQRKYCALLAQKHQQMRLALQKEHLSAVGREPLPYPRNLIHIQVMLSEALTELEQLQNIREEAKEALSKSRRKYSFAWENFVDVVMLLAGVPRTWRSTVSVVCRDHSVDIYFGDRWFGKHGHYVLLANGTVVRQSEPRTSTIS